MSKCEKFQCTQKYKTILCAYLWVNVGLLWSVPSAPVVSPSQNVGALTNAEFLQTVWFRSFYGFSSCMYNQLLNPSVAPLFILEGWREEGSEGSQLLTWV